MKINYLKKTFKTDLFSINVVILHVAVKPNDDGPNRIVILMNEKLQNEQIHDAETEDHPPQQRMRPHEGSVGKGQHGNQQEEAGDAAKTGEKVRMVVADISEKNNYS